MKVIKWISIIVFGVIALLLLTALILPKNFHAEGTTVIQKPITEVYEYVRFIENQENFGTWFRMDDKLKSTSTGEDGILGFKYEWESDVVGDGMQILRKLDDNKRVDIDIYLNGSKDAANTYFITEKMDSLNTKVTWGIDGKMPVPFNLFGLIYDMNKDFEEGVRNLKDVLEGR